MKQSLLSLTLSFLFFLAVNAQTNSTVTDKSDDSSLNKVPNTRPIDKRAVAPEYEKGKPYPSPEQMSDANVNSYYLSEYGIANFLTKFPDFPRFINTNDFRKDIVNYKERVEKWKLESVSFVEYINKLKE